MKECNLAMAMSSTEYSNPGNYFKGWLKNYLLEKVVQRQREEEAKKIEEISKGITSEERARNLEKLAEIRKKVFN